ncbi:hypothetical protein MFIFM68171_06565 [Madurella fahalii]|uniref:C2H2-type domain-containing protein n=1 Tax=Madurella fahalii TaxID=1157608 RepID=A0ABQ0GF05_9PEZI
MANTQGRIKIGESGPDSGTAYRAFGPNLNDTTTLGLNDEKRTDDMARLGIARLSLWLPHLNSHLPRGGKKRSEEPCPFLATARPAKRPCLPTSPYGLAPEQDERAQATTDSEASDTALSDTSTALPHRSPRAAGDRGGTCPSPTTKPQSPTPPFPCPYLLQNPQSHFRCYRHEFSAPTSVIRHLSTHHRRPPYCPVCGQTFLSHAACDRHIVARSCTLTAAPPVVGGLTEEQVDRLLALEDNRPSAPEQPDPQQHGRQHAGRPGEPERYRAIWDVVFPGTVMPGLADPESAWVLVRELKAWWAEEGDDLVCNYVDVEGKGLEEGSENRKVEVWKELVLERMAERLLVGGDGEEKREEH